MINHCRWAACELFIKHLLLALGTQAGRLGMRTANCCVTLSISVCPHMHLDKYLKPPSNASKPSHFTSPQGSPGLDRKQFLHWSLAVQLALTDESWIFYTYKQRNQLLLFLSPIGCFLAFLQAQMLLENLVLRPLVEAIGTPALCA